MASFHYKINPSLAAPSATNQRRNCILSCVLGTLLFSFFTIINEDAKGCSIYVSKPEIMNRWEGFFNPQIEIHSCDNSALLYPNECKYLFPNYYLAFMRKCDADGTANSAGIYDCLCVVVTSGCWYGTGTYDHYVRRDGNSLISDCGWSKSAEKDVYGYTKMCFEVFWSRGIVVQPDGDGLKGCIRIPNAPPPPPFCQQFEAQPEIKVVPMRDATLFAPTIKVLVGDSLTKECSNGQRVPLASTCSDGTSGSPIKPESLVATAESGKETSFSIVNQGKTFPFITYIKDKKICVLFKGVSIQTSNPEMCYELPPIAKPTNLTMAKDSITFEIPNSNLGRITIAPGNKDKSTGLRAFRPKIDSDRQFAVQLVCENADGLRATPKQNNPAAPCDPGFTPTPGYSEDPTSKLICLSGWQGYPELSVIKRNGQKILIRSTQKAFVPYRYDRVNDSLIMQYASPITIADSNQEVLDTISVGSKARYIIRPNPAINDAGTYLYEQIPLPLTPQISSNPDVSSVVTLFQLNSTRSPLELTQAEIENKDYALLRPIDPYMNALCGYPFKSIEYKDPDKEEFFSIKEDDGTDKCDFITIEAWGGGGSGGLFENNKANVALISKYGEGFSGGAANFMYAVISPKQTTKKVLKIVVGAGGDSTSNAAGNSKIELCDSVTTTSNNPSMQPQGGPVTPGPTASPPKPTGQNCTDLITISGARAYGQSPAGADTLTQDKFTIFSYSVPGSPGYTIPSKVNYAESDEPSIPGPALGFDYNASFVAFGDSECKKASQSTSTIVSLDGDNKIAGSGGCASKLKNIWQKGSNGKVKITCEKWN